MVVTVFAVSFASQDYSGSLLKARTEELWVLAALLPLNMLETLGFP